ncbi:uncharacterized protein MYCFIDRAFT_198912 [Pseudocercospora fijiensis CIRAD86]|uniref:Uncharacterized protein n=1 Tax=Pseudocercospora fijiensis (strain CIRAD86) TaxID=383855 RepID=M3APH6_PSEFD|nr:uncharacterized protein MYCFIDRAFT_198912 [Pseudocercospora fijiensis CIRAD86]EME79028.1 hypothetical protein MYCFIDRAFT_198912 [Pseudocercospora fijiensis CIRAD86]
MSDPDRILEHCPFPDVGRSLQPYVKTRQEVAAIRNSLQAKLPNSAINSSLPTSKDIREITSVTGVRKAYLRALQAHQAAQARYDSLKAELEELSHASSSTSDPAADNGSFMTESYIPLMRQREKHRKLKILQATLAKVDAAGGKTIADSFDKVTRRQVGDLPVPPPAAAFAERDAGTESEYDLTRLKKAILAVRHQLEEHEAATVQANGVLHGDLNPHADLYALKKAHNELTAWMEQQLAMISDLEAPKDGDGEAQEHDMSNGEAEYGLKDIESLYEQYLHSREHLLELVTNSSSAIPSAPSSPEVIRRPSTTPEPEQSQSASEALLPYLSRLVLMRQAERDLLQQSSSSYHSQGADPSSSPNCV